MKLLNLARLGVFSVLFASVPGSLRQGIAVEHEDSTREEVAAILSMQQDAWNRGDVVAFMQGYWNSPQLSFAGSSGVTRGWQPVMDRYRKTYPDQKAMGHLDFSDLEICPLGKDSALVIGRWHLNRDSGELGGVFTLVFQKFPEGWRIIHDHTSRDENGQ
jgi:ketosteroid isomerase-like protein